MTGPISFPTSVEELRTDLLTAVLSARTPGVIVDGFEVVVTKHAGEGVASTADRVVLELTYGAGSPPGLPTRLILKTMLVGPHAPPEMYETEVRFYDEIRPGLDAEMPQAFGCHFAPESGSFGLLMEDLEKRDARFPNALDTVTLPEIESLLTQLATVHARFWRSPRLRTDLAWVPTPMQGGMADIFTKFGREFVQSQVDQHPFKQELIAPLGRSVSELWELLTRVREEQTALPPTLLHGDPHIGNTYLLPGERGGLLDFQLLTRGCFAHDVIYLMVTGLATEVRRTHQRSLLEHYLDRLRAAGVTDPPEAEEAWLLCRKASLWGLVIGWLICPPANYGVEITTENIARTVAAVQDLDAIAAIT
ncbi:MAG: phosphotransferase [Candidatus Binatia bacterium]|nr:phosphotransferase [Candidatus Binatia bacterium]